MHLVFHVICLQLFVGEPHVEIPALLGQELFPCPMVRTRKMLPREVCYLGLHRMVHLGGPRGSFRFVGVTYAYSIVELGILSLT